jgi:hypothetical protein
MVREAAGVAVQAMAEDRGLRVVMYAPGARELLARPYRRDDTGRDGRHANRFDAGIDAVCPVPLDTRVWITSPRIATANLAHAATVPASALKDRRVVNLPGLSVTPAEMLDSLERLGGASARKRVRVEIDPHTARIVGTWPGAFDVSRPLALGFHPEGDIDSIVRQFMAER